MRTHLENISLAEAADASESANWRNMSSMKWIKAFLETEWNVSDEIIFLRFFLLFLKHFVF